LSLLEAGVLFVDNIKSALTTHNLAVGASLFDGCSNFHFIQLLAIGFWPLAMQKFSFSNSQ
jgi:hypothetical protein